MKPIRLLILGTSNSVLRGGYTSVFEDHPRIELMNRSVGGAPAVVLAYLLGRQQLPEADFCILDTAVNDANWTTSGIFRVDLVKEMLSKTINEVRHHLKATPIVLILPTQANVDVDLSGVLDAQREVCEETGTLYVDGRAFVRTLMERSGLTLEDCFRDAAHLSLPVAQELGRLLESYLVRQASSAAASEDTTSSSAFRTLDLTGVAEASVDRVERRSRLVGTHELVALRAGDEVEIEVPEGFRLAAIAINALQAFGYLEVAHSAGVLHKDVRFWERPVNPHNEFLMKVVPVLGHVGSGPCRLRLLATRPDGELEATEPGGRDAADRDARLEVVSAVFVRDDQPQADKGGEFLLELKAAGGPEDAPLTSSTRLRAPQLTYAEEKVPDYTMVDLLREMGRLLIDLQRPEEADFFLAHAKTLRPKSPAIDRLRELTRSPRPD